MVKMAAERQHHAPCRYAKTDWEQGAVLGCGDMDDVKAWLEYDMPVVEAYRKCGPGWWPSLDKIWEMVEHYNDQRKATGAEPVRIKRAYRTHGVLVVHTDPQTSLWSATTEVMKEMMEICEHCGDDQNAELRGLTYKPDRIKGRPRVLCDECHAHMKNPALPSRCQRVLEELEADQARPSVTFPWETETWFPGKDQRDDEIDGEPPEWWKYDDL